MVTSRVVGSEFRIDQRHIARLIEVGEFFAAGFFGRPDDAVVVRIAEGLRCIARHRRLPEYRGGLLYPAGPSLWQGAEAVSWYYVSIMGLQEGSLARKRQTATPQQAAALDALAAVWRDYPQAGGYTHSIPHYDRLLAEGLNGYEARIGRKNARQGAPVDPSAAELYEALHITLDIARIWRERFVEKIQSAQLDSEEAGRNSAALLEAYRRVPFEPAGGFREAMVCTNFIMYMDGPDNLGRFDQFMQRYYEVGDVSREEALAYVRQLWRNIDDAHAWNVAVGGSDHEGAEASNEMTLICLEAAHGRRRPNLALRLREDTPDTVWDAALQAIATGCGLPALYCEENYLRAIREAHLNVTQEDIYRYAFGGCTELMVHGRSNVGSLDGDINLPRILVDTLHNNLRECGSFADLMNAYSRDLGAFILQHTATISSWQETRALYHPQPIRSLLVDDCIDSGREYAAGGARCNWSVINVMGLGNVVDSLCAVREVVFDKQEVPAAELLAALDADFDGADDVRRRLERCPRYGNDDERADGLAREVSSFVFREYLRYAPWRGGRFLPACLMFTTYAHFGKPVGATPDGRRAGTAIADSAGPVQGRDTSGPTAMLTSAAGIDQLHAPGTLVVNIRFGKEHFRSPAARQKVKDLIRSYFRMGGMQLQVNVVDQETLRKACEKPEDYGDLLIRVGGFTEYWRNLSPGLRQSILERTEH